MATEKGLAISSSSINCNARGQGLIREPSLALQRLQDLQVGPIEIFHVQISLLLREPTAGFAAHPAERRI